MTTPLKIEVTEAFVLAACAAYDNSRGDLDAEPAHYPAMFHVLTAAFQHPEFLRQIREQVLACVPAMRHRDEHDDDAEWSEVGGYNSCREKTRASLGRLLGEEG